MDLAHGGLLCFHPALRRVNGRVGENQPGQRSKARNISLGDDARRPSVHQFARQYFHLSGVALGIFDAALGGFGSIRHLVCLCVLARLRRLRFEFDPARRDGR